MTSAMRTCPKTDCSIESHVHGHGTDEMFLPKPKGVPEGFRPGSLEYLLAEAFKAGVERGLWLEDPTRFPPPSDFETWRRGMLPG